MPVSTLPRRVREHTRARGVLPVLADCASWGARWVAGRPRAGRPSADTFVHGDCSYLSTTRCSTGRWCPSTLPGVRNADVVDLGGDLAGPYDLVLAVSTLEHVGLDEEPKDPDKPARAVVTLASLLAPVGGCCAPSRSATTRRSTSGCAPTASASAG